MNWKMNQRFVTFLALAAAVAVPTAAHASTSSASGYGYSAILPPGATMAFSDGQTGNPINSEGVVAADAQFGWGEGACGHNERAFVYFPKTQQYVILDPPPGLKAAETNTFGIADDNSIGVSVKPCSSKETFIYRVTMTGTTPEWSQPCVCRGYSPLGVNSDGIALNSSKLRAAVLSFPSGTPKITPLATSVGIYAKARITGVGTPSGFVGTQYTPKIHRVPTVWLAGKPYRLPVTDPSLERPVPFAMAELRTSHGLQVDIAGSIWHRREGRYGPGWGGTDYWLGKPTSSGFKFSEKRRFIRSHDMYMAYGISPDGSMIFGVNGYDLEGLVIYFTASHTSMDGSPGNPGCGGYDGGEGWGDSHGDILVDAYYEGLGGLGLCLAQPNH